MEEGSAVNVRDAEVGDFNPVIRMAVEDDGLGLHVLKNAQARHLRRVAHRRNVDLDTAERDRAPAASTRVAVIRDIETQPIGMITMGMQDTEVLDVCGAINKSIECSNRAGQG